MPTLFKNENPNKTKINDKNSSNHLIPPNGEQQHINILADFPWTTSGRMARDEAVPCYLWEYQPNNAQLINAIYYWSYQLDTSIIPDFNTFIGFNDSGENQDTNSIRNAINAATRFITGNNSHSNTSTYMSSNTNRNKHLDPYLHRYVASKTGFQYILPYLGQANFHVENDFHDDDLLNNMSIFKNHMASAEAITKTLNERGTTGNDTNPLKKSLRWITQAMMGGSMFKAATELLSTYKVNVIGTKSWAGTTEKSMEVNFQLLNTNSEKETLRNWEFCYLFNYQNHPNQKNAFLAESPCIYSLYVPNKAWFPVCYVKSFSVKDVGQTRMIECEDGNRRAIPEVYDITISFTSIINPYSRNLIGSLSEDAFHLPQQLIDSERDRDNFLTDITKKTIRATGDITADIAEDYILN